MSQWITACRLATIIIAVVLIWDGSTAGMLDQPPQALAATESLHSPALSARGVRPVELGTPTASDVLYVQARLAPSITPTPVPPTPTATPTPQPRDLGVFKITGYSDSPLLNGTDGRGITKSGARTAWGVVAVDPRVIPLGSRLKIDEMGDMVFTALDTGGGIRGNWVDVWFHSDYDAIQHGVRNLTVRLLPD